MRVSVGVPVYNGADQIAESLACLVGQIDADFRVVISDNASTDGTSDICADVARQDPRVTHLRRAETSDAATNFMSLLHHAQDDLFMWRAHDDLSDMNYISNLSRLFSDPDCRLAVSAIESRKTRRTGETIIKHIPVPDHLNSARAPGTTRYRMMESHQCWFYGLWHRETLIQVMERVSAQYDDIWGQDHVVVLPMALARAIRGAPETTFIQRIINTRDPKTISAPGNVPVPRKRQRRALARNAVLAEIALADLTEQERAEALSTVPKWLDKRIHSRSSMILGALGLR